MLAFKSFALRDLKSPKKHDQYCNRVNAFISIMVRAQIKKFFRFLFGKDRRETSFLILTHFQGV